MKNLKKETKIELAIWSAIIIIVWTFLVTYFLPNLALARFDKGMQFENTNIEVKSHYAWGKITTQVKSKSINGSETLRYLQYVGSDVSLISVAYLDKEQYPIFSVSLTKDDLNIASYSDLLVGRKTTKVSCFDVAKVSDMYVQLVKMLIKSKYTKAYPSF